MELKTTKPVRLDQLTEEVRALPGLSGIQGLSAFGPTAEGSVEITVHVEGKTLDDEQERAVAEAIERHVPDPKWNASRETKELDAILAKTEGSLSVAEIEKALRILSASVDGAPAGTTA